MKHEYLIINLALSFMAVVLLLSCRTHNVAFKEARTDSVAAAVWHYDSVFIDRFVMHDRKDDTVFLTKKETTYKYRIIHDTVRIVRTDSIPYAVERIVAEKGRKPPWLAMCILAGLFCTVIFLLLKSRR